MTKSPNYTKNEVTLRDYIDTRICAVNEATRIAHSSMEKRLEGMNEFRSALKDQSSTFISRAEHDKVLEDIRELRESRAELAGKASQSAVIGSYILAVLGLLVSAVSMVGHLVK